MAKRFEDLIAWQLAHELQQEVFAFAERFPAVQDVKFCNQIRESARSATRNTAEGWSLFSKEFSRFLRIAAASLHETKSHLHDARDRGFLSDAHHERLVRLTIRGIAANIGLQRYLAHSKAPTPFAHTKAP